MTEPNAVQEPSTTTQAAPATPAVPVVDNQPNQPGPAPITEPSPAQEGDTTTQNPKTPVTEDITLSGMKFDDCEVSVVIPADLVNFTAEKGIDAQAVAQELYSEKGLSEDTKNKLYEAFGKWQVDTYLKGIDATNRMNMSQFKAEHSAATAAEAKAWEETMALMGGEDKWSDLDAFAAKTLSEEEISEFNEIMEKGSLRVQKLMIADLWGKFQAAGAPVAPVQLDLETGSNLSASDAGSAVTQAEYFNAFKTGEYRKDPKGWDARREAGLKKGI